MDAAPSAAELQRLVRDAHAAFTAAIARVPQEMLEVAGTCGAWSVRDAIAHVGADERWMAGQLEALERGVPPTPEGCYGDDQPLPAGIDLSTQDGRNAWQHDRLGGLSLAEVREMADAAHAKLMAIVDSLSDERLAEKLSIANLGTAGWIRRPEPGETAWPLWEWLRGVTYHHYGDHAAEISALALAVGPR